MAAKFFALVSLAVAASALPGYPVAKVAYAEVEAPAHYEFQYSVQDAHSGDVKQQHEARAGDSLQGSYSLIQPDGVQRIVDYTADKENGFNADVRYEGHPTEAPAKIAYAPAPVTYAAPKIAYAPAPVTYAAPKITYAPAPVTYAAPKIAYAPAPVTYAAPKIAYAPVAKVAYAAPVTKVAYSAPVAKLAYAAPLAQVSYSSPVISYQH